MKKVIAATLIAAMHPSITITPLTPSITIFIFRLSDLVTPSVALSTSLLCSLSEKGGFIDLRGLPTV